MKLDPNAFSSEGEPLQVSYYNYVNPVTEGVLRAYSTVGLEPIDGFNSGELIGSAAVSSTIDPKDETRSSSETSFLRDAFKKSGIVVYHNTFANKILFDGKKATGVTVERNGIKFTLSAKRSVILAAGAVCHMSSPRPSFQLLVFPNPSIPHNTLYNVAYIGYAPRRSTPHASSSSRALGQ